jgi:phosphodiesterase/alkaline phosphatase D-like protein
MAPAAESLDAGPILGARTATGAKLWVRIDPVRIDAERPTMLRLELVGAAEGSARTFDAEASIEGDGTAVFRLEGLKPGQNHRYRITRAEDAAATLAEGSFATAPARMTRARIAFGADAEFDAATDATFRAIEREHPDAFILAASVKESFFHTVPSRISSSTV